MGIVYHSVMAQGANEGTDIRDDQRWLLRRRKVPAAGKHRPSVQVIMRGNERAWLVKRVLRHDGHSRWHAELRLDVICQRRRLGQAGGSTEQL